MRITHQTDREKLAVEVEDKALYVYSDCCGCSDELTDPEVIRSLRDNLNELLDRIISESQPGTSGDPDQQNRDVPEAS